MRQQPRLLTSPKYIDERERCIMATITKTYKESVPPLRFIGKKYLDSDRVNGTFGAKWGEWFQNGWFGTVEKQFDGNLTDVYENGNAYIGLMRENSDGIFEYWIGILMPAETTVPEGFGFVDLPAGELGVCWIYGKESEVYIPESECKKQLEAAGFDVNTDWCIERCACPRFTTPDEKGNIILDICFYLNKG